MESKKLYYTMGEVSELFCVAPSLIRYWEKHFSVIKPLRNKKGNRLFTPSDVENFKIIYHLVKERGMTLEGAQRTMKQNRKAYSRDAELLERMQHIRSLLLEVREVLKEPGAETSGSNEDEEWDNDEVMIDFKDSEESFRCTLYLDEEQSEDEECDQEGDQTEVGDPIDHSARNSKRIPDAESKELFAFYEQSLF